MRPQARQLARFTHPRFTSPHLAASVRGGGCVTHPRFTFHHLAASARGRGCVTSNFATHAVGFPQQDHPRFTSPHLAASVLGRGCVTSKFATHAVGFPQQDKSPRPTPHVCRRARPVPVMLDECRDCTTFSNQAICHASHVSQA